MELYLISSRYWHWTLCLSGNGPISIYFASSQKDRQLQTATCSVSSTQWLSYSVFTYQLQHQKICSD